MSRLLLDKWPGRVFKDQYLEVPGGPTAYGYLSIGDFADAPKPNADRRMFAIDLEEARTGAKEAEVAAAMRIGKAPFESCEEIQIGPGRYLVALLAKDADLS